MKGGIKTNKEWSRGRPIGGDLEHGLFLSLYGLRLLLPDDVHLVADLDGVLLVCLDILTEVDIGE